ncbi:MAG: hypothetical protein FD180_2930 [Planctomycetota bacterium]|nr:MAG: hypothetical protein FD180_2930 [Planctomycetota bacterium]
MSSPLDAIGFPTRGLAPGLVAARLAEWVRWPVERGTAAEVERGGRRLRVHSLECGGGARLVTVIELKKRYFLPGEEIVCFFPAFAGGAERELQLDDVVTASCPLEPFGISAFPDRLRFRIGNPFAAVFAAGTRISASLALLAGRVEPAPEGTRPLILASQFAAQDLELPPDLFTVAGRVEAVAEFTNAATGEACRRFRLATPTGVVDAIVRARDAAGAPATGQMAVAEGEFVADVRAVA